MIKEDDSDIRGKGKGMGKPNPAVDKRPLTTLQMNFIEAYFECENNMRAVTQKLKLRSRQHGYSILKSPRVQFEVAKRKKSLQEYYLAEQKFTVSLEAKMQMFWDIAQKGVQEKTLKTGAVVMSDPMAAIKAIQELNRMQGHHSPERVEMANNQPTKPEKELIADAKRLITGLEKACVACS